MMPILFIVAGYGKVGGGTFRRFQRAMSVGARKVHTVRRFGQSPGVMGQKAAALRRFR